MFEVGDRLGDYEIAARLKAGGMATLFLGRRAGAAGFSRHVAIKVVHSHLASDPAFVRMFLDEALLSARINHPNVVHVEELGESDGSYFLVMEYVHGCALNSLLRSLAKQKRKLSPEMATWIAIQIADGLHAAHEATGDDGQLLGVVHRDISPQNVLLAYKGHVKLIDFGIAKARGRAQQTATGASIKGKLRYMSPEQAFGRSVDRTTDIYALAIVLWEMLTMRKMFDADNDFALLDMVRTPTIVAPSTLASDVPPSLDRAILSTLQIDPKQRPVTAKEFRRRLAEAMPTAATLDSDSLADLLATLRVDDIDKERRALPESLSGFPSSRHFAPKAVAQSHGGDDEIIHTVAIDASDISFLDDAASQPSSEMAAAEALPQVKSFKRATAADSGGALPLARQPTEKRAVITDTAAAAVLEKPVTAPGSGSKGSNRGVMIGAAALLIVGVAAGGMLARNAGHPSGANPPSPASATTSANAATTGTATNAASAGGNTGVANTAAGSPTTAPPPNPQVAAPTNPTPTIADAGSNVAANPTPADPTPPVAGRRNAHVRGSSHANNASSNSNTGSQTHTTTSNSGSSGGTHTRLVNGVPIVQDDF